MAIDGDRWLTTIEVARYLRVTPHWVRQLIKRRGLPAKRLPNGSFRFWRDTIDAWLLDHGMEARR